LPEDSSATAELSLLRFEASSALFCSATAFLGVFLSAFLGVSVFLGVVVLTSSSTEDPDSCLAGADFLAVKW